MGAILSNGGFTSLAHKSGSLTMSIHPVGSFANNEELPSRLVTDSGSGSTTITVQSPIWGGKLANLAASHISTGSGSTTLNYPFQWEGGVHVKTVGSGSVNVNGQGIDYEMRGRSEVLAWKGEGKKMVEVSTTGSGSTSFTC